MSSYRVRLASLMASAVFFTPVGVSAQDGQSETLAGRQSTDTIIVNARRREESLQDVPIAITAKSQEELNTFNIESVSDLQFYTPSMQMFGPFRDQPIPVIRGQGGFSPGGLPSVIMYVNEVPAATSAQAGSPGGMLGGNDLFFDLENVQVLKGPQGTLFGRNTTGGAVLLQSKRPQEEFGASMQVTMGNYDNKEIDAVLNVPLIEEKLLVRLAVDAQDRDGYTLVESTPNFPDGRDLDDARHISGRLSVLYRPTDRMENLLIADLVENDSHGTSKILKYVNEDPAHPVNMFFPGMQDVLERQNELGNRRQVPQTTDGESRLERWSVTDIFTWELNDVLTFRNIASYQHARYARRSDGDGAIFPVFDPITDVTIPNVTRQYSEEAQLQWTGLLNEKLDATVGFFYLNQPEEDTYPERINTIFGRARAIGDKQSEETLALFAQADYDLSALVEGLSFTGGFRYTWETITRKTRDIRIPAMTCTSPYADANCIAARSGDFKAPTWTLGFNYAPPDSNATFYVASRRGFRSGGFNLAGDTAANEIVFDPEYVTDIELGVKADWVLSDAISARTNIAAYRQFYTDIQLNQTSTSAITGGSTTVIRNAGKAKITGVEVEGRVYFGDVFEVGGHATYTDFVYTELGPRVILPVRVTTPKIKYGVDAAVHVLRRDDLGHISLRANWNVQGERFTNSTNDPFVFSDEFGVLTFAANWRDIAGKPIDLSFYMTNALDKEYQAGNLPLSDSVGTSTVIYGEPRMWGFRLGYRFGSER